MIVSERLWVVLVANTMQFLGEMDFETDLYPLVTDLRHAHFFETVALANWAKDRMEEDIPGLHIRTVVLTLENNAFTKFDD